MKKENRRMEPYESKDRKEATSVLIENLLPPVEETLIVGWMEEYRSQLRLLLQ